MTEPKERNRITELKDKNGLTEAEYLASYHRGDWPLPSVTADQVLASQDGRDYDILLIRRGGHPCIGQWALPGGFVNEQEPPWKAAARELAEETGLSGLPSTLLGVFGDPSRDVRGWTITCAYCTLVDRHKLAPKAGDDAQDARWFRLSWKRQDGLLQIRLSDTAEDASPCGALTALLRPTVHKSPLGQDTYYELLENQGLAFDHAKIIATAIPRLEELSAQAM